MCSRQLCFKPIGSLQGVFSDALGLNDAGFSRGMEVRMMTRVDVFALS